MYLELILYLFYIESYISLLFTTLYSGVYCYLVRLNIQIL